MGGFKASAWDLDKGIGVFSRHWTPMTLQAIRW